MNAHSSTPLFSSPPPKAKRERAPSVDPDSGPRATKGPSPLVLVVDDHDDVRELYADTLREAGYDVAAAADGESAVELALRLRPRLVLMDLSMPNMDGWEATQKMREAFPDPNDLTVLAISSLAGTVGRAEVFQAGADGFIAKPCTPDILLSVVRVFIG